jgi:murein DD-endopeptidase MepM/ murein hydrolase activator NlpD
MAASDGRITYAGPNGTFGNFVRIQHTGGVITEYAHLSRVLVNVGQRVKQEEIIGRVGMTGLATGPHLHYQLQQNGSYVNPRTARLDPPKPIDPSLRDAYMTSITGPRSLLASLAASDSVLMAEE